MIAGLSGAAWRRIVPFAVFMVLLALRGALADGGPAGVDPRWVYGGAVLLVGGLLIWWRRDYGELAAQTLPSGREAMFAAAVGLVVFLLWTRLDAAWMRLGETTASFVPVDAAGRLEWPLVAARALGATLVVPVMEELFWRSFFMRWIHGLPFEAVPPQRVGVKAIVLSTFVFVLAHTLWLAAVVAGLACAWLYIRSGKLWMAVIAHAVTNGALAVWVVLTGSWQFW